VAPAPAILAIVASATDAGWVRAVPFVVHCCAMGEVTADGVGEVTADGTLLLN